MEGPVFCSNLVRCPLATEHVGLDSALRACPHCGKLLASPHEISVYPLPPKVSAGSRVVVTAKVTLRAYMSTGDVIFDIDGQDLPSRGPAWKEQARPPAGMVFEVQDTIQIPENAGLHGLSARVETSEGRCTYSGARAFLVSDQPDDVYLGWIAAFLIAFFVGFVFIVANAVAP